MKGQRLFHGFLPGVTAAVLTTQPVWASTAKVSEVQLQSSPSILTSTNYAGAAALLQTQPASIGSESDSSTVSVTDFGQLSQEPLQSDSQTPDASTAKILGNNEGSVAQYISQQPPAQETVIPTANSPTQPQAQNNTAPGVVVPTPPNDTTPGVVVPAPPNSSVEVPDNLNASPNPLRIPTKTNQVTLKKTQPITLEQAIELAKQNNNNLQVSLLQLKGDRAALRVSQASLLPTLGLNSTLSNSRSSATTLQYNEAQAPVPAATTAIDTAAQLTYNLYTSGQRTAGIKAAEEQVRADELAVETQYETIRLNVATNYYNLQQADEQVRISQAAVENGEASLRDAQALELAGVGTRFDTLSAQVNLANSQQQLTSAIAQQEIARRQLATSINLTESVDISSADPVQLAGLWNQTLEQSILLAYQNRSELQQNLAQRNLYEQQRRQALASLGPQVSFVASYDVLDQFNDNQNAVGGYSVGLQATLNLFDGGAAKARAAQASANKEIAEYQFSEQRNQIRFQVEQSYYTLQYNLNNVQTANVALVQAKEALRLARLRFQAGVGTETDIINSENSLTQAEGNRVQAILNYNRALVQLERSVSLRALSKSA